MANYLKNGQLALAGEENVNDKPAYKIKATVEGGLVIDMFIDKSSYFLVKTSTTTEMNGMTVTMDSYPSDYTETSGIMIPMKPLHLHRVWISSLISQRSKLMFRWKIAFLRSNKLFLNTTSNK